MFTSNVSVEANPPAGTPVAVRQTISYVVTLTNDDVIDTAVGAGLNLTVSALVPAGTTLTAGSVTVLQQPQGGNTFACQAGTPSCTANKTSTISTFDNFATFKFQYRVTVNAGTAIGTVLNNTATYVNDGGPATVLSSTISHAVAAPADLSITKSASPVSVIAGGTSVAVGTPGSGLPAGGTADIDYLLLIANAGPNNATNVTIEDAFPANTVLVSAPALATNAITINGVGAPTFAINCTVFGNIFQCTPGNNTALNAGWGPGVLPNALLAVIRYRVRVPANVAQGTILHNEARISSTPANPGPGTLTADPNTGNNYSTPVNTLVNALADLGITKVTSNPTPTAGGAAFSYTLTVTNLGPSDAQNVIVSDPMPPGIIFQNVSVTGAGAFSCAGPPVGTNGVVSCTSGVLPASGTATITIVAQVVPNVATGVRTNTATVTSATTDPGPPVNLTSCDDASVGENADCAGQNIVVNAPLSITKAGPATLCAGDTYTYHVTVLNGGTSTALNATISDQLPLNTTFLNYSGTGAFANSCSHNGGTPGTITCASVDIPSGLSTLDITVKLAPGAPSGALSNTANINSAGTGTIAVGTSTTTATVNHCSDLEITKDDSPDAVLAGEDIKYSITVKNVGPSDISAGEFVVNDPTFPPAGTTLKTGTVISATGFNCNGTTAFPCTATAALPAGATATIKFTVTVNANFNGGQPGGFVTNTATVAIANGVNAVDSNQTNNSSTTNTPIGPSADLSVTKAALTVAGGVFGAAVTAGGGVTAGFGIGSVGLGEIEYTLTYRNSGLGDATNVHIRDVIPAGTLLDPTFLPIGLVITPIAGPGLTCQILPTLNTYQLDCTPNTANGILPAGANGTIQFAVRVPENMLDGAVIKNVATINSEGAGATPATPDPNGANNTSAETQNIVRTSADLSVTKIGPASIVAGTNITYTLTVTNNGDSDAQDVLVKDTLPPNVSFVSLGAGSDPRFACAPDNGNAGIVNCTAATLIAPALNAPPIIPPRNGANVATIIIVGRVAASVPNGTVLTNNASVSASTQDPFPADNAAAPVNTTVATEAAVTIVKTDNLDPAIAGTNLTYTITVANNGPSDAQGVNVVDTLPPATQVQFLSVVGTGVFSAANSCSNAGNVVTCNAIPGGVFPAGATANITITVRVLPNVPANPLPHTPDNPAGLLNTAVINWTDSNGVVGALVAQTATDTERTTVRHESDMSILKEAPDYGIAGTRIDYRLTIANKGPSDVLGDNPPQGSPATGAGSIIVRDVLPVGTSLANIANNPFVAPNGPGGFTCTYTAATREVLCKNAPGAAGNFFAGASLDIIIKVDIDSNVPKGTNLVNCATISLRNTNPTPEFDPLGGGQHNDADVPTGDLPNGNNQSCDTTLVRTEADLAIGKSAVPVVDPDGAGALVPVALPIVGPNVPPGSVNAGGYIRYDVPFGNNGPSDAVNVLITDQIAGNTAFVGALATGGVFTPNPSFTIQAIDTVAPLGPNVNLTCTVFQLPGTQSIYCRPQGNTLLGAPGPYADGTLPAGYNGTLTFFVKVNESVAGGTIVSNPANITSGLCPNAAPPVFPPSACESTDDPNTANNTTLPTQTGVIASSNLTISKVVQSAVTTASNPAQAGVIGPATPPNGAITSGTAVLPGTFLTYRVTVTNNGPSDVSNIRVTDLLPSGLETPPGRLLGVKYVSVTPVLPSGATFTCLPPSGIDPENNPQGNGGSLVCTAPLLSANAPNNTAAIDIKVFIDPATKANLVNLATFDATLNNFNRPVSGSTTLTTPVAPNSNLVVVKSHAPDPVIAGTEFDYTITMTNNGPSAAQMVTLTDIVPAFQQIKDIQITQVNDGNVKPAFSCTPAGDANVDNRPTPSSFTCTSTELPPNKKPDGTINPSGSVVFKIRVKQGSLSTGNPNQTIYQNCLTVTSMSFDPTRVGDGTINSVQPPDNTADGAGLFENVSVCDNVNVIFRADLATTKTDSPDPVIAGTLLTYTVNVTNNGPSAALNLKITDPLPAGTVFWDIVNNGGATTVVTPAQNTNGVVTATWAGLTDVGVTRTLIFRVRVCSEVLCNTVITNRATGSSDTTDPNPANNVGVSETTVQAQSDLQLAKGGPASAPYSTTPVPSIITYTLTFQNNGPSNSAGTAIVDVLPKGFTLDGWTSTVAGTTLSQSTVNGITTLTFNLGILGPVAGNPSGAIQCATTFATGGTITIRALVPIKHPVINVTNTATISTTNCLADPNLANNTSSVTTFITMPGQTAQTSYPARTEVSDMQAGSILFYPLYTSDVSNFNKQNTRFNMTNVSTTEKVCVHLFMVDGSSCSVLDLFICLTPNQTASYLASDLDPGNTGYIMAVAVDCSTGLPRAYNCLVGDEYVKMVSGHQANLGAEAIQAVMMFPAGTDPTVQTVDLKFDGVNYNQLPRVVAADNIQSTGDGNSTLMVLNRVAGNFTGSGATIGGILGLVYDDQEVGYSFTANLPFCQYRSVLSNTFPRLGNQFTRVIPGGRTGWMRLWTQDDKALFGATINYNPNTAANTAAFNQGHNLHHLTLTDTAKVTIPVFIPSCSN
ncbi:MAG: DUF11 domain-containing protein [Acidobacteria bacterium]|nr:DUF11 domain-containing protein [Acidobacteriota bacterium]